MTFSKNCVLGQDGRSLSFGSPLLEFALVGSLCTLSIVYGRVPQNCSSVVVSGHTKLDRVWILWVCMGSIHLGLSRPQIGTLFFCFLFIYLFLFFEWVHAMMQIEFVELSNNIEGIYRSIYNITCALHFWVGWIHSTTTPLPPTALYAMLLLS